MNRKCIGCGITLQDIDSSKDGYVCKEDFNICTRCFRIKNYGENKVTNRNNSNYMDILNNIKDNDYVIYVSSLLTLNLDYIDKFRNVILVLTKRDIIPKSVKDNKIINYIKNRYNIKNIVIVSAYKKKNLDNLYNLIKNIDSNIYFVGTTNSGKSTLINELINIYGNGNGNITMSAYPSTTLDIIDVNIGNLTIKDTPGIVIDDSIINSLDNKYLKNINSKKEIKPITFQIDGEGSIMIDNLFRIDYNTLQSSITIYMSNNLNIRSISLNNNLFKENIIKKLDNIMNQDIVIEDIGFIKVTNKTNIKIYYNNNLNIKVRDNLI